MFGMGTGVAPPPWSPETPAQFFHNYTGRTVLHGYLSISNEAARPISTARLNTLLCLHLRPIKLVISEWP